MQAETFDDDERYQYAGQAESAQRRHETGGIPAGLQTDAVAGEGRQEYPCENLCDKA